MTVTRPPVERGGGKERSSSPRGGKVWDCLNVSESVNFIVSKGAAGEDTHILAYDGFFWNAGVLKCFEGTLEGQALLWVERGGFLGSDIEERSIEDRYILL